MAEHFLKLSDGDRRDALRVASNACGRPTHLLEKDVWVVWALETVFATSFGPHLVFKGGTSLSKAYQAIHRFSEDVDLTYDIRAIAPDLVSDNAEALPPNRSQEKKWSKEIRSRLNTWIATDALPAIERALTSDSLTAHARAEDDKIIIDYGPLTSGTGYVRPAVLLEFGARATGEPWETRPVACDAATHLPQLEFPHATPQVMKAERTFWEKATAIHVFCLQGRFRGAERFARHWYDITRLDELGYAAQAFADADIAHAVARHKAVFFPEKTSDGELIDYMAAVTGGLRLTPEGEARRLLAEDYRRMVDDGLFLDEAEPFETLLAHCERIELRVNDTDGIHK